MASKLPKRGVGAEIGVETGNFSAHLLRLARPTRLHLIDPWEQKPGGRGRARPGGDALHDRVCRRFAAKIQRGTIVVHRCRSAEAAAALEPLDWVYIDGNHTYQNVKEDLEGYYALLTPGGIMAGDDYGMLGYRWGDGVREAVDEFVHSHGCSLTVIGHQFVITKPA
ncbi:MAG: class I SAM-dependent methyltransferase [Solirubrobacteraceae bacterium]